MLVATLMAILVAILKALCVAIPVLFIIVVGGNAVAGRYDKCNTWLEVIKETVNSVRF